MDVQSKSDQLQEVVAMRTPWGELQDLDLSDTRLAETILCSDKHQLVEGMIVECLFDQFLESLSEHVPGVIALNVETIIAQPRAYGDKKIAVVWARKRVAGLGRYLQALERKFQVFLVEYRSDVGFFGSRRQGGARSGETKVIEELLAPVAARKYQEFEVSSEVRNDHRLRQAIWGFLFPHHKQQLADKVLLPRLLMNCGVQPWFRFAWNVDRIFIVDDKPWLFEVKHKFPFLNRNELIFGLNNGEVGNFSLLAECGIGTLFSIMVKPKWSKTVGSLYMMTDLKARENTAVLGQVLDTARLRQLMATSSGTSGADTTITGDVNARLKYKPIPSREFGSFGRFSDRPSDIAEKMVAEMRGSLSPRVEDEELQALRMSV